MRKLLFVFCFLLGLLSIANAQNQTANPINIGFSNIDEEIRNLQLLGKVDSNQSLAVRPFYTSAHQSYGNLLNAIDPNFHYNAPQLNWNGLHIEALPISLTQKINTNRPFGWNDQAMGFTKGYQAQLTTGLYAKWGIFNAQYQPELVNYANGDFQHKTKLLPGQSFVGIRAAGLSLGISSENLWWGPGQFSSLTMSNNAQGFEHIRLNSTRPLNIGIGKIEFQLILGRLTRDTSQGWENNNLQKRSFDFATQPNFRQYNGLNIAFQPKFAKNLFIGFTRAFDNYEITPKKGYNFLSTYLPVLNGLFKNNYSDDTLNKDQILSLYTRWLFPNNHAEIYFEYGYNDAMQNLRDLLIDMSHSGAYTFGFKKLHPLNDVENSFLTLNFEATKMSQTPSYLQRNAGNWYEHGQVTEGITNQNQIMGAGSGMGNDVQTIVLGWQQGFTKLGFKFQHIANNPYLVNRQNAVELRNTKWDDYVFGANGGYRYKNIIINANLEWVNARNYNWVNATHLGNLHAFINTIFLW